MDRFPDDDPGEPGLLDVPRAARTGLLEGVAELDIFRTAPRVIDIRSSQWSTPSTACS